MAKVHLTKDQRRLLRAQLCSTEDVNLYRRTLALLEVDRGRSPADIARSIGVSCSSVYNWLDTFASSPEPGALMNRRGQGRPTLWADQFEKILREALEHSPLAAGYQALDWTVPLLQIHLTRYTGKCLSVPTIRRKLHEMGYIWKHSRYVLTTRPPAENKAPEVATVRTERVAA
jgi:transposase